MLAKNWVPLIQDMSAKTGINIQFATAKDIPEFERCLSVGAYDLAYMNPYHYTEYHKSPGYIAFAHQRDKKLRGIIVAQNNSAVNSLEDLRGRKVAFPSPAAFGASVLPRAEMRNQKIPFEPIYVKSHDSVYLSVAVGLYPAGGGVLRTFRNLPNDLGSQLKIFYQTKSYTPHAFAVHPNMPPDTAKKLAEYLSEIDPASPLLEPLGMDGIVLAHIIHNYRRI